MVLSTLNTMESLGLDIQQCVVSCFNDFTLEASCSEVWITNQTSVLLLVRLDMEMC